MSEILGDDKPQTISLASLTGESSAGPGDDAAAAGIPATTASAEDLLLSSTSSSHGVESRCSANAVKPAV